MSYKAVKIKTVALEGLIGKNINVRSFIDGNVEIISAIDTESGEIFVLKEVVHAVAEPDPGPKARRIKPDISE